ncbi:transcription initiation factor IIE, beta subunit [Aulographum hederae CBS 113979]|uniref:Transcription initiation factor IIE subunit beta n=1 Tax=Aulographum hederae CBS 113979 TaxID=1176131 RepID=A0A6G1HFK2_9PEZI|nr:transcription initiation factor IIE, beta subunit [Aulographum hederae CBS 113979]
MSNLTASPSTKLNSSGPISIASPTPSASSQTAGIKRKRLDNLHKTTPVPVAATTESGGTILFYGIEFLKKNPNKRYKFDDVANNAGARDEAAKAMFAKALAMATNSVEVDHNGFGKGQVSYRFKPRYPVRNEKQLKSFLQEQISMRGFAVAQLKEGFPDVGGCVDKLAQHDEVLLWRDKKNMPKMVWANDPSLKIQMDKTFVTKWHEIALPAAQDDLRKKLEAAGIKASSQKKAPLKVGPKQKRKAPRRGGRQTNTHMTNILKDYSHRKV